MKMFATKLKKMIEIPKAKIKIVKLKNGRKMAKGTYMVKGKKYTATKFVSNDFKLK